MLKHLTIQNYALISSLDITFDEGFSVLTGETGAGKSIILGALSLLMGARADISAITDGEQKCTIEAEFDNPDCIIRRELFATGKSRSFVDDSPVTLAELKPLAAKLIDIHSQHENLLLSDPTFWLEVVDALADNQAEREAYAKAYVAYRDTESELSKLRKEAAEAQKNSDFIAFQHEQLSNANLQPNELNELEQQQERLAAAEEIRTAYSAASACINGIEEGGILSSMKELKHLLSKIETFLPKDANMLSRIESAYYELQDISDTIEQELSGVDVNPAELQMAEDRISFLRSMLRKFGKDSIDQLIAERDHYAELLERSDSFSFDIEQLEKQLQKALTDLQTKADLLSKTRQKVAPMLKARLEDSLSHLGVRHAAIEAQLMRATDFAESGQDEAMLLFAANLNQSLRPVSEVASGGEMARLMLSVKALLADKQGLPTVIFDEVDTGVSGEVASEMALLMREMAKGRQVLAITHLPQIAARGHNHYRVYKEDTAVRTETHICRLTPDERPAEIAMLLSGAQITDAALENAKQLLANNI